MKRKGRRLNRADPTCERTASCQPGFALLVLMGGKATSRLAEKKREGAEPGRWERVVRKPRPNHQPRRSQWPGLVLASLAGWLRPAEPSAAGIPTQQAAPGPHRSRHQLSKLG